MKVRVQNGYGKARFSLRRHSGAMYIPGYVVDGKAPFYTLRLDTMDLCVNSCEGLRPLKSNVANKIKCIIDLTDFLLQLIV